MPSAQQDAHPVTVALREALIARLKSLDPTAASESRGAPLPAFVTGDSAAADDNEFQAIASALRRDHPTHLPALVAILTALDDKAVGRCIFSTTAPMPSTAHIAAVVAAADAVVAAIDTTALAAHFGVTVRGSAGVGGRVG